MAKFTPKSMAEAWEKYKVHCDSQTAIRTEFSQKTSEFVTATIPAPITYTVKGFCIHNGMTEQNFYATYNKNERFESVVARMKDECEIDARRKFENNTINSRLAGLWMSNYGYTTKAESKDEIRSSVVIVDDMDE